MRFSENLGASSRRPRSRTRRWSMWTCPPSPRRAFEWWTHSPTSCAHTPAVRAAGAIHSDFEKKFIRAEVVNWKSLVDLGGYAGVREKGLLTLEGKGYIVKDGDVLVIRHG